MMLASLCFALLTCSDPGQEVYAEGVPPYARFFGIALGRSTREDMEKTIGPPDSFEATTLAYWGKSFPKMDAKRQTVHFEVDSSTYDLIRRRAGYRRKWKEAHTEYLLEELVIHGWPGRLGDDNPFCSLPKYQLADLREGMSLGEVRKLFAPLKLRVVPYPPNKPYDMLEGSEQRWIRIHGKRTQCLYSVTMSIGPKGFGGYLDVGVGWENPRRTWQYVF